MVFLFTITKNKIKKWGPILWQCTYWYLPQNTILHGQNTKQIQNKTNAIKAHKGPDSQLMGLLPDTQNCGLRTRRECRKRFPRQI